MRKIKSHETLSSNTLFHFTNSYDNIINILTNYFVPRISYEILHYENRNGKIQVVNGQTVPLVCFCDLPLSKVKSHVETYGNYAIGLSKDWGIDNDVQPVLYYTPESFIYRYMRHAFLSDDKKVTATDIGKLVGEIHDEGINDKDKSLIRYKIASYHIFNMLKLYEGIMLRNEKFTEPIRFYDEREWRYVPEQFCLIEDSKINVIRRIDEYIKMDADDRVYKGSVLKFDCNDVKYLILNNETEITNFSKRMEAGPFSENDVSILLSKVLTIDQVLNDF